ncbi:hypothetical protein BH24ACI3_BH24ACI3_10000 [soil metagenome]
MKSEFSRSIQENQADFGLSLNDDQINRLEAFYRLILEHNPLLHLVGPSSDEEFATRHILESLSLLEHLSMQTKIADIGAGAGLPSLPCLVVREGLTAILIESKEKKAKFLEEAVKRLGLTERVTIVAKQFEETDAADSAFVTCRALDKFAQKLPRILKWSGERGLLFFGGENLSKALQAKRVDFVQKLLPLSERRFLFIRK